MKHILWRCKTKQEHSFCLKNATNNHHIFYYFVTKNTGSVIWQLKHSFTKTKQFISMNTSDGPSKNTNTMFGHHSGQGFHICIGCGL